MTMTKDEISKMPASREMDILIAEKVMKLTLDWEFAEFYDGEPAVPTLRDKYDEIGVLPYYSTLITDAWEVTEKLEVFRLTKTFGMSGAKWIMKLRETEVFENTAPLAICRAALLSMLDKENP